MQRYRYIEQKLPLSGGLWLRSFGRNYMKKGTRKKGKFSKKEERGKKKKNKSKDGIINAKEQN